MTCQKRDEPRYEQITGEHEQDIAQQAARQSGNEPPLPIDQVGMVRGQHGGGKGECDEDGRLGYVLGAPIVTRHRHPVDDSCGRGQCDEDPERRHVQGRYRGAPAPVGSVHHSTAEHPPLTNSASVAFALA